MLLGDSVAPAEAAGEEVAVEAVIEVAEESEVDTDDDVFVETDVVVEFWVMLK